MNQSLLDQLRDIHAPAPPSWWPPAPGGWRRAARPRARGVGGVWRRRRRGRRFRPARQAALLHGDLSRRLAAQTISAEDWLHETNQLLKRLAVHGLGHGQMASAWDKDWLLYLDARYGTPAFSQGAGQSLGLARFRADATPEVAAVDALVTRLLQRECRKFWRWRLGMKAPRP